MTAALTLVVGNKNYSSWSMRPWVALRGCGVPFAERVVKFESEDWKANIATLSPSGLVPVLWEGAPGSGFATWDTLAIVERANELFPDKGLWPADPQARARARSVAAEMHSGFRALRGAMPMNLRGRHPGKGMNPEVARDIARITRIWTDARAQYGPGGAYLFGAFSAADAFYAPVATRFMTYGFELDGEARAYQQALLGNVAVKEWTAEGIREKEFYKEDEPYTSPAA
ncbi:MAG: glutathione S-transferase family protein [Betaproteobacteria bacterium]|nr:glutathione S-transferase family protein [Betaproteobacteria bacterium]